jgi:formylmethanofuran dehydrogenase subunit E
MVDHDPEFWPTFEEAEQMLLQSEQHWANERDKLDAVTHVSQSLEGITVICKNCGEIFYASDSKKETFDDGVRLHCPKCEIPFKYLLASKPQQI